MSESIAQNRNQNDAREVELLTAELVRRDSSNPGAFESEVMAFVRSWLTQRIEDAGLAEKVLVQEVEALPGRSCLRALIPAATSQSPVGSSPADLTFLCHMDTVILGEGWSQGTPPLSGRVLAGELYGRGSCDMKGGLACAMLAFDDALQAVASTGTLPDRSLALVCTVDEEADMHGVEATIAAGWLGATGWVLDTEPTDGYARGSHKGRLWMELAVDGTTAHASTPWEGADAVAGMAEAIHAFRRAFLDLPQHPELGSSTVTFGQVMGGYQPYVVPDRCRASVDMRLVPPTTTADACALAYSALRTAEKNVPGVRGSYRITGNRPAVELNPNSKLLSAVRDATSSVMGTPCGTATFTGYTDTAVVAGMCGNTECLSYGPGSLEVAHKPNEHVPVADLVRVRAVLSSLALARIWA